MTSFSKYFHEAVHSVTCQQLSHDGSCLDSTIANFTKTIPGCVKFVLPLALIPIIMKIKNLDKDVIYQSLGIFVDYFFGAWLISGLGLSNICFFRKILGCFYYPTVLGVPAGVGAFISAFVLAERAVYTYAHGLSTIVFQVSLNRGDFYILKILRNSRLAISFAFMILNTILMHGLRENETGRFYWITQPLKRKANYHEFYELSPIMDRLTPVVRSQIKCCEHEQSCDSYIMKGIQKYFKFGMGLEIARTIIYNYSSFLKRPLRIFEIFIKRLNWNLVLFLVGYVGVYRFIHCLCNRHNIYLNEDESKKGHQLASFLSGFSFYFYPNFAIFSHTAVNIVEIYWNLYYDKIKSFFKGIPFDKIRMKNIVFPFVFGYALHIRAFEPWLAPSILMKLMHLTTNYKDADIYTRYHSFLFGLKPQFFL